MLAGAAGGVWTVGAMGWIDWAADSLFAATLVAMVAPRRWRKWVVTAALPHPKWAGRWVQGWSSGLPGVSGLLDTVGSLDAVSLPGAAGLSDAVGSLDTADLSRASSGADGTHDDAVTPFAGTGGTGVGDNGATRLLSAASVARKASNLALAASNGESVDVDISARIFWTGRGLVRVWRSQSAGNSDYELVSQKPRVAKRPFLENR